MMILILEINAHLYYKSLKKSTWEVELRAVIGSRVTVGNPVRIKICQDVRTFNPFNYLSLALVITFLACP